MTEIKIVNKATFFVMNSMNFCIKFLYVQRFHISNINKAFLLEVYRRQIGQIGCSSYSITVDGIAMTKNIPNLFTSISTKNDLIRFKKIAETIINDDCRERFYYFF